MPDSGVVRTADGQQPEIGQQLSPDQLTQLVYDAPLSYDGQTVSPFVYTVSDGQSVVTAQVDIEISGLSRISGQVEIIHDDDDDTYAGYALNNRIEIHGRTAGGDEVTRTVSTDIHGFFEFDDLEPGTWTLRQQQPGTVHDAGVQAGQAGGIAGTNEISSIQIPVGVGADYTGYVFYEFAPAVVSGFVHLDENFVSFGPPNINITELGEPITALIFDDAFHQNDSFAVLR